MSNPKRSRKSESENKKTGIINTKSEKSEIDSKFTGSVEKSFSSPLASGQKLAGAPTYILNNNHNPYANVKIRPGCCLLLTGYNHITGRNYYIGYILHAASSNAPVFGEPDENQISIYGLHEWNQIDDFDYWAYIISAESLHLTIHELEGTTTSSLLDKTGLHNSWNRPTFNTGLIENKFSEFNRDCIAP